MTDAETVVAYDDSMPSPGETETATFALGCFWGPDATFGAMEGVVRTRVGYAGGSTPDPTYHDIGDHSEAVQVEYDPAVVSFADLVEWAVEEHSVRHQPRKRQYQHVLFYADGAQRRTIENRLDALAVDEVRTRVEGLSSFTNAEDYHQKYNLRSKRAVLNAFEAAGYDDADVRDSPAAAKLNARAAGKDVTAREVPWNRPVESRPDGP